MSNNETEKTRKTGQQQIDGVLIGRIDGYEVEYSIQPKETLREKRIFDPMRGYGVGK